jgi:hypothetical protein
MISEDAWRSSTGVVTTIESLATTTALEVQGSHLNKPLPVLSIF